jgi:SAM-dependent methyltransferase
MLNLSVFDLLVPVLVILTAILYLPITLITLITNQRTADLTSWKTFQQAWFSSFWHFFGWASRPLFAPDVEKVLSNAHGVVVDVGSGSGDWLYLFSEERNSNISKLYLVEPNTDFHPALRRKIEELGFADKCQIVRRVEDLEKVGVEAGTVDTVATVHVLCSVQTPGPLVEALYRYLKPNGQWHVYEHVKARNSRSVAGVCQGKLPMSSICILN